MQRRRRFHHEGVYFAETAGMRGAQMDLHALTSWLRSFLQERGLLGEELVPQRGVSSGRPEPRVSVDEALEALASVGRVLSDCAAVVERVWQGQDQVGIMLDAAEASDDELAMSRWLLAYDLVSRIADDHSPVRRDALTLARATLRVRERSSSKVKKAGALRGEVESEAS